MLDHHWRREYAAIMYDLFCRISNHHPFPKFAHFRRGIRQEKSRVAKERFATVHWRDVAMKDDVMRRTGNECAVPMKRDIVISVKIILSFGFHAEIVNCSEVPFLYRAELFTKFRERISFERCKS